MKTFKLISAFILVLVLIFNSTEWSVGNSGGAVPARTGAPTASGGTELTCQACHGGGLNTGPSTLTLNIEGNPQFINAGQAYVCTVALSGGNGNRGFQIVALNAANNGTGTFTPGSNNRIASGAGRQYVTHNSGNSQSWVFTWTAPTTAENVTFYVASGTKSPANTYTLSKAIPADLTSIEQNTVAEGIKLYPSFADQQIFIQSGNMSNPLNSWTIVDQLGKTVAKGFENETNFGEVLKIDLPSGMKSGAYSVLLDGPKGRTLKRFIKN